MIKLLKGAHEDLIEITTQSLIPIGGIAVMLMFLVMAMASAGYLWAGLCVALAWFVYTQFLVFPEVNRRKADQDNG